MLYFIIALLFVVLLKIFGPQIKGSVGEYRVVRQLNKLPKENYRILNDVMLQTEKGTSQIDHIVISPYGIFVIETKNYRGWIHGNEYSDYWTQSIYQKKIRFRNPIKQNWGHIVVLKELLKEYADVPFYSIIVFAGSAELKNVDTKTDVIYDGMIYNTIMNYRGFPSLQLEDIEKIVEQLTALSINDRQARKQHVQDIRSEVMERQLKEDSLICPKCGGILVSRSGQYGEFYGCSNYPKCRYKMNK